METYRKLTLLGAAVALTFFTDNSARACGPFFEEAPPTLPYYLGRLPAKSLAEIFSETTPEPARVPYVDVKSGVENLAAKIGAQPASALFAELEAMARSIRQIPTEAPWRGAGALNLLHDLHDAISIPKADPAELADYIRWRVDHAAWFGLNTSWPPEPRSRWYGEKVATPPERLVEIDKHLAGASPALRPQWLYLRGALEWKNGDDTDSERWFKQVLDTAPAHPRAEAALFMVARCALSQSRSLERIPYTVDRHQAADARAAFEKYLKEYPDGRFAADTLGWLGALAFDARDYPEALEFYIRQTGIPAHPELLEPALTMCERILSHLASDPQDAALAEVAQHPRLAMGMVYLIVSTPEANNFDGELDDPARVRGWRKNILPRLAHAVAGEKQKYDDPQWQPRFLAILAQAASGAGDQARALTLTEAAAGRDAESDDLVFARAVALQRAGKFGEAIEVYRGFLKKFTRTARGTPEPLAAGARLRLALALQDNHEAGEAIVELSRIETKGSGDDADQEEQAQQSAQTGQSGEDRAGAAPAEVRQIIDTLLNFAPLPELAAPLARADLDEAVRLRLGKTLTQRYLARDDFQNAKRFVTPADWARTAAPLETLALAAADAKPGEKRAEILSRLGDKWAAARGRLLTEPLDGAGLRTFNDDAADANFHRLENGRALLGADGFNAEMESRDELRHASARWLDAASAQPASPLAASAFWRALRAMPLIADVSPYTLDRAVETNATGRSKELYERLRRECPDSREARDFAVYWNFPPPPKENRIYWRSSYAGSRFGENGEDLDGRVYHAFGLDENAARQSPYRQGNDARKIWEPIIRRCFALEKNAAAWQPQALAAEVEDLRGEVRAQVKSDFEMFWLNFLDDLAEFFSEPAMPPRVRERYVALRTLALQRSAWGEWPAPMPQESADSSRSERGRADDLDAALREKIAAALADPEMQPAREYLAFLDFAVVANHQVLVAIPGTEDPQKDNQPATYRSRDYALLERLTAEFLRDFPKSRKREAALLLHARAVFRLSEPHVEKQWIGWPESGRWEGRYVARVSQRAPFDPKRVLAALEEYGREFPEGRYAAEIQDYRASVAVRTQDWKEALRLSIARLEDKARPELRPAGARHLAAVFNALADENSRAPLLRVLAENDDAKGWLAKYLAISFHDHPLRYLGGYLAAQLGISYTEPAARSWE